MTDEYIKALVDKYSEIRQVWLIGSRANNQGTETSDWDYLVFGSPELLKKLSSDFDFRRCDMDLLVVYDGDAFEAPWTKNSVPKCGSLSSWNWKVNPEDECLAMYDDRGELTNTRQGRKGQRVNAKKIYP